MPLHVFSRRDFFAYCAKASLGASALVTAPGFAQVDKLTLSGLAESRLRTFDEMVHPFVQSQNLKQEGVSLTLPSLADNGHLVPLHMKIDSPMTEASHVSHIYLISQRNPVPLMCMFVLGPLNGRAEISTRVRLSGTQMVVALARLSDGHFIYQTQEVAVTEAACVDNG
ncbi:MAG: sulfur oxidation protein SoxY [Betaproteobacteria bacterium]|nr:sulfur oxidation protein SoxY [Betaproteobacteria bacterium]